MTREHHAFTIDLEIYRLCSRCGQPDLAVVRRSACRPLHPEVAARLIARKMARARQFFGPAMVPGKRGNA